MWTAQHRGEEGKLTTLDGEKVSRETHMLLQLVGDAARGEEEEESSNGVIGTRIREN
jgi:hypothetical protein